MPAEAVAPPRAYMIRMKVPASSEAASLAEELEVRGASVERNGDVVTSVWEASDADHVEMWSENTFPELVFFLRSWAGLNADRQLVVLEEHALPA
jgi:hypothetical protein